MLFISLLLETLQGKGGNLFIVSLTQDWKKCSKEFYRNVES